jgi:hypothetical protein
VGVDYPYFNAIKARFFALRFETQYCTHVDHATYSKTNDDASTPTSRLHHWGDKLLTGAFEIAIAGHRVYLVWYVIMF